MSRKSSPPSIQTPVLPHTPCCSWPAQALFWRRQLWMPMAIWYLNKASVYIKTHMPFSAKFLGCFEEREELEQNTLNYQILHERERYHRSLKRSSQSNCRLELRVIFFFCLFFFSTSTLWCIGAIKVLHVSVKVSLPDRLRGEWQACSMCSKREYVCHRQIPKANSQVCAISSALTDGEPSRRSRLAAFRQLWTSRSICCRTHFQNAAIELLTHHKKKKKTL